MAFYVSLDPVNILHQSDGICLSFVTIICREHAGGWAI